MLPFLEDRSDRQAAEAVRAHMEWTSFVGLEVTDVGFDVSVLSTFRDRLVRAEAGPYLFERVIEKVSAGGWIKTRGVQRTDSTHVLAAVRRLTRVAWLGTLLRAALTRLAEHDPEWLTGWVPGEWCERSSRRLEEWRLPAAKDTQEAVREHIGQDGLCLLSERWREPTPASLRALPEIEGFRTTGMQPCFWHEGVLRLRATDDLPPAHLTVRSPDDHHAHCGHTRELAWFGDTVHVSESGEEDLPPLLTHVDTRDATTIDREHTDAIPHALHECSLSPGEPLLDAGIVVHRRPCLGSDVRGPVSQNNPWQARAGEGSDLASFRMEWQKQQATCPQGKVSVTWTPRTDPQGHPKVAMRVGAHNGRKCPTCSSCTRSPRGPRILAVRTQAACEVLQHARQAQQTETFRARNTQRSGSEGTHSQAVRSPGLRRTRSFGLPKTARSPLFTATAITVIGLDAFLEGKRQRRRACLRCLRSRCTRWRKGSPTVSHWG